MVTRSDVNRLSAATTKITDAADYVLSEFFSSVDLGRPVMVRDALLDALPVLAQEYGDLAATVAAEWYEQVRLEEVGGSYSARLGATADVKAVQGSVRWAAGELYTPDPQGTLVLLRNSLQRYVMQGARDTIAANVQADTGRPRYAVVPTGPTPCPWCLIMASRGWAYSTERNARKHSSYHDSCKCQVVPAWGDAPPRLQGYDPDGYYKLYAQAREEGEPLSQTAQRMRTLFPDLFPQKVDGSL